MVVKRTIPMIVMALLVKIHELFCIPSWVVECDLIFFMLSASFYQLYYTITLKSFYVISMFLWIGVTKVRHLQSLVVISRPKIQAEIHFFGNFDVSYSPSQE